MNLGALADHTRIHSFENGRPRRHILDLDSGCENQKGNYRLLHPASQTLRNLLDLIYDIVRLGPDHEFHKYPRSFGFL